MHLGDFRRHCPIFGRENEPKAANALEGGLRQRDQPRFLGLADRVSRIGRYPLQEQRTVFHGDFDRGQGLLPIPFVGTDVPGQDLRGNVYLVRLGFRDLRPPMAASLGGLVANGLEQFIVGCNCISITAVSGSSKVSGSSYVTSTTMCPKSGRR